MLGQVSVQNLRNFLLNRRRKLCFKPLEVNFVRVFLPRIVNEKKMEYHIFINTVHSKFFRTSTTELSMETKQLHVPVRSQQTFRQNAIFESVSPSLPHVL